MTRRTQADLVSVRMSAGLLNAPACRGFRGKNSAIALAEYILALIWCVVSVLADEDAAKYAEKYVKFRDTKYLVMMPSEIRDYFKRVVKTEKTQKKERGASTKVMEVCTDSVFVGADRNLFRLEELGDIVVHKGKTPSSWWDKAREVPVIYLPEDQAGILSKLKPGDRIRLFLSAKRRVDVDYKEHEGLRRMPDDVDLGKARLYGMQPTRTTTTQYVLRVMHMEKIEKI